MPVLYALYEALFDLTEAMDHGGIVMLASDTVAPTQIGIASEGGSGTEVPDLSIEASAVDETRTQPWARGRDILL